MIGPHSGRRRSILAPAAIAVLLLTGCAAEPAGVLTSPTLASSSTERAAGTPTPAPTSAPPAASTPAPSTATAAPLPVLPRSEPTSLHIPSTGTTTDLMSLGLQDDGSLEVPPGNPGSPASWYNQSPTPGERGPAVVLGHVNATDGGPGVFAHLRDLVAGDTIEVTREDGSVATFEFQRGEA